MMLKHNLSTAALALSSMLLLASCGDSDNNDSAILSSAADTPDVVEVVEVADVTYRYQITVTNLTNAQPLSPIATILHTEGRLWEIGQPASAELEVMAESGDNTGLLGLFSNSESSEGILMPGESTTIEVSILNTDDAMLSISSMLVNTNDAFVGLSAMSLTMLEVGDSTSMTGAVYDAGTEGNTEAAGTIPGPADGGAGYLAARDDVDFVARHAGVVTQDDGLSSSVLTQAHKFDNPAVRFTISRVE